MVRGWQPWLAIGCTLLLFVGSALTYLVCLSLFSPVPWSGSKLPNDLLPWEAKAAVLSFDHRRRKPGAKAQIYLAQHHASLSGESVLAEVLVATCCLLQHGWMCIPCRVCCLFL